MQTMHGERGSSSAVSPPGRDTRSLRTAQGERGDSRDVQFIDMLNGYRLSGGLARSNDVIDMLRQQGDADVATLARWIVRRELIHFDWQAQTWLPLFQLKGAGMRPHVAVGCVLAELNDVMPPWAVAQWFARPNVELDGRRPADALAASAAAVWQAARADLRPGAHQSAGSGATVRLTGP
jgi:hypothetical protein